MALGKGQTAVCRFKQDGVPRIGMLNTNAKTMQVDCVTYRPEDERHRFILIMDSDRSIPDSIQDLDFHAVDDRELLGLTPDGQGLPDPAKVARFRKAVKLLKDAGGDMLADPALFDKVFGLLYAPELATGDWKDLLPADE
ncbi:hypothetical protein CSQ85_08955 [Bifidobacterium rousetti]|uniref:hypothetical protein n=1 Tax=Bifidobacterium rousetti TaxID=2045439 RepID=UPI0012384B81|nr:hypothetical protein [Bifidobacterium rousetti]KAA8818279.1 hypothetical protein CSQ85_08955 [Bifidobacterium rousetti]